MTNLEKRERLRAHLDRWYNESPLWSSWISSRPVRVYMRKSPLPEVTGHLVPALTLANINVQVSHQRQGWFKDVIQWMHDQRACILKVENVIVPWLADYLTQQGWERDYQEPPSFRKVIR